MNEKEQEKIRQELRKLGDKFLERLREQVDNDVLLCDVEGFDKLVSAVNMVLDHQIVEIIRKKGFSKEFGELCDKVGRGKK